MSQLWWDNMSSIRVGDLETRVLCIIKQNVCYRDTKRECEAVLQPNFNCLPSKWTDIKKFFIALGCYSLFFQYYSFLLGYSIVWGYFNEYTCAHIYTNARKHHHKAYESYYNIMFCKRLTAGRVCTNCIGFSVNSWPPTAYTESGPQEI